MTPARPMLAEVLAALTDLPAEFWRGWDADRIIVTSDDVRVRLAVKTTLPVYAAGPVRWAIPSVAEAFEVLQTRGLIPDGYVGRFICSACGGTGTLRSLALDLAEMSRGVLAGRPDPCPECTVGFADHPATMADLVAWASLGFAPSDDGSNPGVLGHEEAAMQANGAVVCWCPGGRDGFDAVSVAIERNRTLVDYLARLGFRGLSVLAIPPLTPA